MTYLDLSRKTGVFVLGVLFVLVTLFFTNTSIYAEGLDSEAQDTEDLLPLVIDVTNGTNTATSTDKNSTDIDLTASLENLEKFECEIEGHKYDQNGNPLSNWKIGLMKIITQDDKIDIWNLAEDVTDTDGYYCLEWDGETRVLRGDTQFVLDKPFDLVYRVYEELTDNWSLLSIEKGDDINNISVVDENDIRYDGDYVSTQIGEINGYVYANAAYHVDFYNVKNEEEISVVDGGENGGSGGSSSGGSGTRVGDRNRGGGSSSNPEPQVLGEATSTIPLVSGNQVTIVPTGAPGTGAGGSSSNSTLTFNQVLYINRFNFKN